MTEKDVMVGDYFRVNRECLCIKKDTIVEVRGIDANDKLAEMGLIGAAHCRPLDDDQFDGGIWLAYLEPIPLTAEILEKNGFVKSERYEVWKIISDEYELRYTPWRFAVIFLGEDGADKEEFSTPRPKYVHELQHALRLCGISKDIIL